MKRNLIVLLILVLSIYSVKAQNEEEKTFGRNNLSIMLADVVLKRVSFEYEHVFGDEGNMSINVPFSVSIGEFSDIYDDEQQWWGGLGMKLYPTGQGKIRYYFGPEVRVISAKEIEYIETYNVYYENYVETVSNSYGGESLIHTAFLLNNGMIYEPTEHFIFSVNLGLGFISRDQKTGDGILPMATPSVRMGIRF